MPRRVLSGMRPTGSLHLGHLRGVLHNWRALQDAGDECFFFVADWHALTTDYAAPADLSAGAVQMVRLWLAAGLEPSRVVMFRQSEVPAHAELFALLAMICPLPWLLHLPTYKEQKEALQRDLDTYGFLGYPLLQSADILMYGADCVPVGEDQVPHIEFTREVARRFNRLYGGSSSFEEELTAAVEKAILEYWPKGLEGDFAREAKRDIDRLNKIKAKKEAFEREGDKLFLEDSLSLIEQLPAPMAAEKKLLRDWVRHGGREILRLPEVMLTKTPKLPGTDGRKMSKSYNNTIDLDDPPPVVSQKIARMTTDPARIRRTDKGDPKRCPVWSLHRIFSDGETQDWAAKGCSQATIGCVECKQKLATAISDELDPLQKKLTDIEQSGAAQEALCQGAKQAAAVAGQTMDEVRAAMFLSAGKGQ